MLKNIYAPLSGGMVQEKLLDIISNNLANSNTTAFKEEKVTFKALESDMWPSYNSPLPEAHFKMNMQEVYPLHGNEMQYVAICDVKTDFAQGNLRSTGNVLDFALEGEGFFALNTPFGERYTRDGSFALSPDGVLINKSGAVVLGSKGAITGLKEGEVQVLSSGEVYCQQRFADKIKLVDFKKVNELQKIGKNMYIFEGDPKTISEASAKICQGFIENSNSNPIQNLNAMIAVHRAYEALLKSVKAFDESMGIANNKIGEV